MDQEDGNPSGAGLHGYHRWLTLALFVLVAWGMYYVLITNKVLLTLQLESDVRTVLKVYWPNQRGEFSEKRMAQLLVTPDKTAYQLRVCDMGDLSHLRLDPSEKPGKMTLRELTLRQTGYPVYGMRDAASFENIQVLEGVASLERLQGGGISMLLDSRDPQLKLLLPQQGARVFVLQDLVAYGAVTAVAVLCWAAIGWLFNQTVFVPLFAAFVAALILTMAGISKFNAHPDEVIHISAGEYYENNFIPPRIGDPAIEHTYSPYGVSRLHSGEIVYLVAGKFLQILYSLHLPPFLVLRLFNVLLFSILVLYALNRIEFRFFLFPLLISPQVWYVFSYFNSDAFATFISLIAAYQIAADQSSLNSLLYKENRRYAVFKIIALGVLLGSLLLVKMNFYFLYVFLFFYFIWRIVVYRPRYTLATARRLGGIVLVGLVVFCLFRGMNTWVNDFDMGNRLLAAREQYATPMYKPSTPLPEKHPYLQMKERGTTLDHFINVDRWGEKSFRTSFGVYGYTSIPASFAYYNFIRIVMLLLLISVAIPVLWRGRAADRVLVAGTLASGLLLLVVSAYHAWTVDFQSQGRYFLPILPMLAVLYYHTHRFLIRPVFYALFLMSFFLSVYNFVFVGLREIEKYVS